MNKRYCTLFIVTFLCLTTWAEVLNGIDYRQCTLTEAFDRRAHISDNPQYYVSYAHFDRLSYNSFMNWNQVIFYENQDQFCSFIDYKDVPSIKSGTVLKIFYRFVQSSEGGFSGYLETFEITDRLFIQGTNYVAKDNLRIRSESRLTSDIIGLLKKGEYAKVIEIGNKQAIDGITSAWVKVQTKENTEGWCFGGYLGIRLY